MTWVRQAKGTEHIIHRLSGGVILYYNTWGKGMGNNISDYERSWVELHQTHSKEYFICRCVRGTRSDIDAVYNDKQEAIEATVAVAYLIGANHKGELV